MGKILHMNGGNTESSYANNSSLQQKVIFIAKPIRTKSISDLCSGHCSKTICIADLGCSTGPNSFLVTSEIVETIQKTRRRMGHPSPEVQVFLNDLPGNDFNTLFRLLQEKQSNFRGCYYVGVPGSFYDKPFPSKSLHFVHSSNSLHWLSQVPEGLENNKENIWLASTSPPSVHEAYYNQFHNDFFMFLRHRSIELVPGGCMVLTMVGRRSERPDSLTLKLLAETISDMVSEGLVQEQELHAFNVPYYAPSPNEISTIVEEEGSFIIDHLETIEIPWSAYRNGSYLHEDDAFSVMKAMRSVLEPQLLQHFHEGVMDEMFRRYHKKISKWMAREEAHTNMIVSMKKKTKMEG